MDRFWDKVDKSGECWQWTASCKDTGYGQINIGGKNRKAHRVSWELANGPIPEDLYVCHTCDNRRCVNPDHLWLGTHAENMADCHSKGRVRHGERHADAKLTADDVENIRANSMNLAQQELADIFGVSPAAISMIVNRKRRKRG